MRKIRGCILGAGLLLAAVCVLSGGARGASPEPGDEFYRALRYNDTFSWLSNPTREPDLWDSLKKIPLGDGQFGPSFLTMGGELRERFESYINPNFGLNAPRSNAYLLHRLQIDTDIHLTNYARAFVQIGGMERIGDRGVTSTTDIDHFDLFQAFVDLTPPGWFGDAPVFRMGREELLFGFQRLIAVREGPNVRRDFDGFRFSDRFGDISVDLVGVRPVNDAIGDLDDHTNMKQLMWGAYVTLPSGQVTKADIYALNYENTAAKYRGLTGVERRQTFGIRLFGEANGFDWNGEAAIQSGTFRGHDIRAGMLAGIAGFTFPGLPWTPRIAIETNAASGDNSHSSSIGTFNAMFPRLPYFAETSLLVPANVIDARPVLSVRPNEAVIATFGWDTLWRASATDGLYGSGMALYPGTNKHGGMSAGTELSADVRWRIDQHLQLGAIAAQFMSGPSITEALGKTVSFYVLFATYRF